MLPAALIGDKCKNGVRVGLTGGKAVSDRKRRKRKTGVMLVVFSSLASNLKVQSNSEHGHKGKNEFV